MGMTRHQHALRKKCAALRGENITYAGLTEKAC